MFQVGGLINNFRLDYSLYSVLKSVQLYFESYLINNNYSSYIVIIFNIIVLGKNQVYNIPDSNYKTLQKQCKHYYLSSVYVQYMISLSSMTMSSLQGAISYLDKKLIRLATSRLDTFQPTTVPSRKKYKCLGSLVTWIFDTA